MILQVKFQHNEINKHRKKIKTNKKINQKISNFFAKV